MEKKKNYAAYLIIASAIIWGAVIYGSASTLKETDCYAQIQNILVVGTIGHMLLVWLPMVKLCKRKNEE